MRNYLIAALIAVAVLGWADRRGWGLFDERGGVGPRSGGSGWGGSGRVYHK